MNATFNEAADLISETLDELAAAWELWDTTAPPPGPCCEKLNEAAGTLQRAVSRIIILMGEANRYAVEKAQARGEKNCAICFKWLPEAEMDHHVIEKVSKKGRETVGTSGWWSCRIPCKET